MIAAFEEITAQLLDTPEGQAPDPQAQQQAIGGWLSERLGEFEVVIDEAFGTWDPGAGQVVAA